MNNTMLSWLVAWIIVMVVFLSIGQTGWGRTLAYYFLWLAVLLLVVTHADEINTLLTQGGIVPSGS